MTENNEPKPDGSEAGQNTAENVKRQAPSGPTNEAKPDEGLRPDQLTTENDGGAEG